MRVGWGLGWGQGPLGTPARNPGIDKEGFLIKLPLYNVTCRRTPSLLTIINDTVALFNHWKGTINLFRNPISMRETTKKGRNKTKMDWLIANAVVLMHMFPLLETCTCPKRLNLH